jgi:hypothetical protein
MISFGQKIKLTSDRKKPESYDFLWWGPKNQLNQCDIGFAIYKDDKINVPYPVGFEYHIMVYPKSFYVKSDAICIDTSIACLIDPLDYCETLASNYYGVIGKCSEGSSAFFRDLKANLIEDGNLISLFNQKPKDYGSKLIDGLNWLFR